METAAFRDENGAVIDYGIGGPAEKLTRRKVLINLTGEGFYSRTEKLIDRADRKRTQALGRDLPEQRPHWTALT